MSLEKWESDFEARPEKTIVKIVVFIVLLGAALTVMGRVLGWFGETEWVAKEQFGPRAVLKKYEWFKDAAAELEAKQANIGVYKSRMDGMAASYSGEARNHWTRSDQEQYNVWSSEVAGVIASYNNLAAEYNAAMAKVNWRFANTGELPAGAEKALPREFKSCEIK